MSVKGQSGKDRCVEWAVSQEWDPDRECCGFHAGASTFCRPLSGARAAELEGTEAA